MNKLSICLLLIAVIVQDLSVAQAASAGKTTKMHYTAGKTTADPSTTGKTTAAPSTDKTTKPASTAKPVITTIAPAPSNTVNISLSRKSGKDTIVCFRFVGQLNLTIPYNTTDKKQTKAEIQLTNQVTVTKDSKCASEKATKQVVVLDVFRNAQLEMKFSQMKDKKSYALSDLSLTYKPTGAYFPKSDSKKSVTVEAESSKDRFSAVVSGYYMCMSLEDVQMGAVTLHTKDVKVQAFDSKASAPGTFNGEVKSCSADAEVDNVVPIAVGAALAGLVVIVLIAYIIGRQRNRTGYQSV